MSKHKISNNKIDYAPKKHLAIRHVKEKIFKLTCLLSIAFAIVMLFLLLYSIFSKGYSAFYTHYLKIDILFSKKLLSQANNNKVDLHQADYDLLIEENLQQLFLKLKIKNTSNINIPDLIGAEESINIKNLAVTEGTAIVDTTRKMEILVSSNLDMLLKNYLGSGSLLSEETTAALDILKKEGLIIKKFNKNFFNNSDSRYPELAGVAGAFIGSLYTVALTVLFSVIISVGAAIYLQEFAPKGRLINFIDVNINNLAAVPSIIFGLLGLILFQQFLGIPRSTPLLGSFVLTLMALPTIIIASRIALASVPSSIKEAAYGLGSSKLQVIIHHLLPGSIPGILTGIILSISRIIGETAPLLMIGMVAFINNTPTSITSKAVVFPVQILLWSDSPEVGYIEKASAASMLLLIFLIFINWISIYLRNKFEVKF